MDERLVPAPDEIYGWIEHIYERGVRRPAYPADAWTEEFCRHQFETFGLGDVHLEPVEVPRWEPVEWSLTVLGSGQPSLDLPCFPLPHSAPTPPDGIELALARLDGGDVRGRAAVDVQPMTALRFEFFEHRSPFIYDPDRTFEGFVHVLPFGPRVQQVMEPAIDARAAAYVGILDDGYPDSCSYYVPYDGAERPIPGVWLGRSGGARLLEAMAAGARIRLRVVSRREPARTHNVVGVLPGASDEWVVIGSHHDGPWASAVEDAAGVAMVLAQAAYWSRLPAEARPHNLLFVVTTGHMVGGAGTRAFIADHADLLPRVVLEVHLEHPALECRVRDGRLVPTGLPEPAWWFMSRNPSLEAAVRAAIEAEDVRRSLIVPPTIFGPRPTTDGGAFHTAGVPLVNFLTAPVYLFDACDTLDKVDRGALAPVTRAAVRIIESTAGVTGAMMRAGIQGDTA